MILPLNAAFRNQRPSLRRDMRRDNLPTAIFPSLADKRLPVPAEIRHQIVVKVVTEINEPHHELATKGLLQLPHPQKFLHHAVATDPDWLDLLRTAKIGEEVAITHAVSGRERIPEHDNIAFGQTVFAPPAVGIGSNVKQIHHQMMRVQVWPGFPSKQRIELDKTFASQKLRLQRAGDRASQQ